MTTSRSMSRWATTALLTLGALFTPSLRSDAQQAATAHAVGEAVEVEATDGKWYPATVTAVDGDRYQIHFANAAAGTTDPWLNAANHVRPAAAAARQPAGGTPDDADVAAMQAARAKAEAARARAEAARARAEAARRQAAAAASNTPAPAARTLGEAIDVEASDHQWYPATVVAVNGSQYKVHFANTDEASDVWLNQSNRVRHTADAAPPNPPATPTPNPTPAPDARAATPTPSPTQPPVARPAQPAMPPTPAPDPAAVAAANALPTPQPGPLNGLYMKAQWRVGLRPGTGQMTYEFYYFLPDGHVYFAPPPNGMDPAPDYATLKQLDPGHCGVYALKGATLTLQRADGKPRDYAYTTKDGGETLVFDGDATHCATFKSGQTFEGRYLATGSARGGVGREVYVFSSSDLRLHANGTYDGARMGTVDAVGPNVSTGGSAQTANSGTYKLQSNTITFTDANGLTKSLTAFPWGHGGESPPEMITIGTEIYSLQK